VREAVTRLAPDAQDAIALRGFVVAYLGAKVPWVASSMSGVILASPPSGAPEWTRRFLAIAAGVLGVGLVAALVVVARRAGAGNGAFERRGVTLVSRFVGVWSLLEAIPKLAARPAFDVTGGIVGGILGVALLKPDWMLRSLGVAAEHGEENAMEAPMSVTDRDLARLAMKVFGWMLIANGLLQAAGVLVSIPLASIDPATRGAAPWLVAGSAVHPLLSVALGWIFVARAAWSAAAVTPLEGARTVPVGAGALRSIFRLALVAIGVWALLDAIPDGVHAFVRDASPWRDAFAEDLWGAISGPLAKSVLAVACIAGAPRIAARLYPEP